MLHNNKNFQFFYIKLMTKVIDEEVRFLKRSFKVFFGFLLKVLVK